MGKENYVWVIDGLIDKAYHDYFQTEEHAASEAELQPAEEINRSGISTGAGWSILFVCSNGSR